MTVRILAQWQDPDNGRIYLPNNLLTRDAATETGLIAQKMADANLTGGTAWVAPVVPESIDEVYPLSLTTDGNGNTVLVGADGESRQLGEYGFFYARPTSFTSITTGAPVKINFNAVIEDTHGIYNTTDNTIDIPVDCKYFDAEYAAELASVASGFGSSAGTIRGFLMNDLSGNGITGLGALACSKVGMDGGAYSRHGMRIINDPTGVGLSQYRINPRFTQDSGVTIRVGDSSGTGVAQTYIKIRLYK